MRLTATQMKFQANTTELICKTETRLETQKKLGQNEMLDVRLKGV